MHVGALVFKSIKHYYIIFDFTFLRRTIVVYYYLLITYAFDYGKYYIL